MAAIEESRPPGCSEGAKSIVARPFPLVQRAVPCPAKQEVIAGCAVF